MAMQDDILRHQLNKNHPYSSLLTGLEIAVAPKPARPQPDIVSQYSHKPLPPLPLESRNRRRGLSGSSSSMDMSSTRRFSSPAEIKDTRDRQGSTRKIEQLTEHSLNVVNQHSKIEQTPEDNAEFIDRASLRSSKETRLTNYDSDNASKTSSHNRQRLRSDSVTSMNSVSVYSQDEAIENAADTSSKWGSWVSSKDSPTKPTKRQFYLKPGTYSASTSELGSSSRTTDVHRPILSLRHKDRCATGSNGAQAPRKAAVLDDMVKEERERMEAEVDKTTIIENLDVSPDAETSRYPSWNSYDEIVRSLTPQQPLAIRPKTFQGPDRCVSRFSDHSSKSDAGIISNARVSVISHIRSIQSPFKTLNRPSVVFKGKAATTSIRVPSTQAVKRKRGFSSGKHPLKSPFRFSGPLHKKTHVDDLANPDGTSSSFGRRLSNAAMHFTSPIPDSRIILNHARTGDGPDTPLPTKSNGFMGVLSPTTVLQKGTLQIQEAIQKARQAAKIRSRDERRRNNLKKTIVVIGGADQSPNGMVTRWL